MSPPGLFGPLSRVLAWAVGAARAHETALRGLHPALGARQLLSLLRRPALSPHLALNCGKCAYGIRETLAHAPGRTAAPCAAKSSPDVGALGSRKFRLRCRPWHLCFKINPAIRQISPSCARSYFGRLYSLSGRGVMRSGTFPAIQGWSHPLAQTCNG